MNLEWLRENWRILGGFMVFVLSPVITGGIFYLEWRLDVRYSANLKNEQTKLYLDSLIDAKIKAIEAIDLAGDQKIIAMDTSIAANTRGVSENEEDISENKQIMREVAAILMAE